ncbi:uncharacterized protein ACMZJ9_017727 [Mantella aurantiaca]
MASADLRQELSCSICANLFTDPVTLTCGHSFCRTCVDHALDAQEESGIYTCPECKDHFQERPVLSKDQSQHEEHGSLCDYCMPSPVPAVKCCLLCESSLCDDHLNVHSKSEEHVLSDLELVCLVHKKVLGHYCCEDAEFICDSCILTEEHTNHQVKPIQEASEEMKQLGRNLVEHLTSKIAEDEIKVQGLQEAARISQEKLAVIKEKVNALFRDLKRQLDNLEKKVLGEISQQEERISLSISDLIQQLEIKKDELSRKMHDIEELCNMNDPLSVLEEWKTIKEDFGKTKNGFKTSAKKKSVADLDEGLISATLHTRLIEIVTTAKKDFYVQQAPDFILDVNTASNNVYVSGDLKMVSASEISQNRTKMPERFQYNQVFGSKNFLSGKHYWEVETGEGGNWRLGMSYPSITRKGYHSLIGHSNKSWGLCRYFNQYFAIHDRRVLPVLHKPSCNRLGVYLDYEAGVISFYELCDPIRLLYTFSVTFSEPLLLVFGVYTGWMRIKNYMASADLRDELNCSICLSIYTDPVTLRCGHNFCQLCIDRVLNTQAESGVYSCPDCREGFHKRPAVHRNLALRNIAERFLSAPCNREDSGIFCSYCIHSPVPAAKSCLLCEASLCHDHLRVHSKSEEHVLSDPTTSPGNTKCTIHKKPLMYYCTKDRSCVCLSCCLNGDHMGHQVDLMNEASEKKKKKLNAIMETLKASKDETDTIVNNLYDRRKQMPRKVEALHRIVNDLFKDLKKQLDDLKKKVLNEISRQEKQNVSSVSHLIQQLETKKVELSRKMHDIEELCNMTDPVTMLQNPDKEDCGGVESENKDHHEDVDVEKDEENITNLTNNVGDLDEGMISVMLHKGLSDILTSVRKGFPTRWASDILLDVRTASNNIQISGDYKIASWSQRSQGRQETPERFQSFKILSTTKFLSGRHFWEVEANKMGCWRLGVAYASIGRKGDQSNIGNNDKSWGLRWSCNQLSVRYDCKEINLSPKLLSNSVGIYLDYEGGRLSFYDMCNPPRHLHSYKASFMEPLHVAFALWNNAWLKV